MAPNVRKRPAKGADAYELRVFLGRDASGKVRHQSRLFHGTQRAAEREQRRLQAEHEAKPSPASRASDVPWGPRTTINDAVHGWKRNGWQDLSPTTTRRYESIVTNHIEGSIGKRMIASLSPYDVQVYLRGLKDKGLAQASVRQTRQLLHRACHLARLWSGNVLPNPVSDAAMPAWSLNEQSKPRRAATITEVHRLLAAANDQQDHAYLLLVAATGIRRGEACAVRWSDLDLTVRTLNVDEGVVPTKGGREVRQPKTRAGVRKMTFDSGTAEALLALKEETARIGVTAGFEIKPEHFVFARELPGDAPPYPDSYNALIRRIRRLAGVDEAVSTHSLRRFQSTELDPILSDRQKQARMGWTTGYMARHYTDRIEDEDRRAAEHIGRLLAGEGRDDPQTGQEPTVDESGA